jgi:hypothetical protein
MQVNLNSEARSEVIDVADYYEGQRSGLGDEFIEEFDRALDIVESHGARMASVVRDIRVVRLMRFPYGIYYRIVGNTARVLTVKHLHRDPEFGLDRT